MPCAIGSTQNSDRHGSAQLSESKYGGRRYGSSRVSNFLWPTCHAALTTTARAWRGPLHGSRRRSTATKYVRYCRDLRRRPEKVPSSPPYLAGSWSSSFLPPTHEARRAPEAPLGLGQYDWRQMRRFGLRHATMPACSSRSARVESGVTFMSAISLFVDRQGTVPARDVRGDGRCSPVHRRVSVGVRFVHAGAGSGPR
jgi:hypothetical protein